MRFATPCTFAAVALFSFGGASTAHAETARAPRPYCAPEVSALGQGVCYSDGTPEGEPHKTLLVYLHGALPCRPGVAYLQQRAMAWNAKKNGVTILMPTAPETEGFCFWPRTRQAEEAQEVEVVDRIASSRRALEEELGTKFEETFVVGFSSGAYYASSLAMRDALENVDGYMILAGGSPQPSDIDDEATRLPVFVGVAGGDPTTAGGAMSLGGELQTLGWPSRMEQQGTGHLVDSVLLAHGLAWLRTQHAPRSSSIFLN